MCSAFDAFKCLQVLGKLLNAFFFFLAMKVIQFICWICVPPISEIVNLLPPKSFLRQSWIYFVQTNEQISLPVRKSTKSLLCIAVPNVNSLRMRLKLINPFICCCKVNFDFSVKELIQQCFPLHKMVILMLFNIKSIYIVLGNIKIIWYPKF